MYSLNDFEFDLPNELIATFPCETRTGSRLLHFNKTNQKRQHRIFSDIEMLIQPGDLLVFNDTKVIKARLRGFKASGGQVELLIERMLNAREVLAQLKVSKPPKAGDRLYFAEDIVFAVIEKNERFYHLRLLQDNLTVTQVLDRIGEMPIPPYFARLATELDNTRYQTVYAKHEGSVASPTAGLHFDDALLQRLQAKGVNMHFLTLQIGAGTFLPVRVHNIAEHRMHKEYVTLSQELVDAVYATKQQGGRIIAVGTTSVRALESASRFGQLKEYHGETDIFIYPGFTFQIVDAMITNFHLPGSSLIMLVAAFAGLENTMSLYKEAIAEKYRFFSYGDAMFIAP